MSAASSNSPDASLDSLVRLVRRLRAPDGCPWDRQQTLADVRGYLLEEAHEVAAAIDERDVEQTSSELGDLLFQVVFAAELASEDGGGDVAAIARAVHDKMVERHPHVFGDEILSTVDEVSRAWELRKAQRQPSGVSILDGVPTSLPALLAAYRMTQKAGGVGFDWPDVDAVLDKIDEELTELREAFAAAAPSGSGAHADRESAAPALDPAVVEEMGDLLFAVANLSRHLGIDPEAALARTNLKFRRRFAHIEAQLGREGTPLEAAGLERLDELWERAKASERATEG